MADLFTVDDEVVVSVLTLVEATSALARRQRKRPEDVALAGSRKRLQSLSSTWVEVAIDSEVRRVATDLLFSHPLRASDALQLATAIVVSTGPTGPLPFVTLDQTLASAARAEGFTVLPAA